jgi:hypothetical protein
MTQTLVSTALFAVLVLTGGYYVSEGHRKENEDDIQTGFILIALSILAGILGMYFFILIVVLLLAIGVWEVIRIP